MRRAGCWPAAGCCPEGVGAVVRDGRGGVVPGGAGAALTREAVPGWADPGAAGAAVPRGAVAGVVTGAGDVVRGAGGVRPRSCG